VAAGTDVVVNREASRLASDDGLRRVIADEAARGGARVHETRTLEDLDRVARGIAANGSSGVVLAGGDGSYMAGVSALALCYVAGIMPQTSVWALGTGPLPPKKWLGRGRPPKLLRRDGKHQPISVKELALGLPKRAWRTIKWREGATDWLSSRFARVHVRVAHRDYSLTDIRPEEWLLIEWPKGENEPTKYWLSTLPKDISFRRLVNTAKLRWRIERDYQELKQEFGLGHFEGRGWRGFHHHATLCIAAYGFLISERETIPPCRPRSTTMFTELAVPDDYRPRGSAVAARASHSKLNRNHASAADRHARQKPAAMSMLQYSDRSSVAAKTFVTQ